MCTWVFFVQYSNQYDNLNLLSVTNMQKSSKSGTGQTLFYSAVVFTNVIFILQFILKLTCLVLNITSCRRFDDMLRISSPECLEVFTAALRIHFV